MPSSYTGHSFFDKPSRGDFEIGRILLCCATEGINETMAAARRGSL
jgi:hypothetical protein